MRLIGVDLARGLAVFGMYAAHVGPDPSAGGPVGPLMELGHGRASALFAVLAGFSLILITGRRATKTGEAGRRAVARVVVRALILLALGSALTATGTPVEVILAYYAVYFLLALPLRKLSAGRLALIAAGGALALPQALYAMCSWINDGQWASTVISYDPLARIRGTNGVVDLLFTGSYPVLTWMPYVIAGMAVARIDLESARVRRWLAAGGAALAVLGYGGSWLALHLLPHARAVIAATGNGNGSASAAWWSDTVGNPDSPTAAWLVVGAPHSETTFSIVGNTGVALVVLALSVTLTDRFPRARWAARPVIAVGTMSLTAYVLNIAGIAALNIKNVPGSSLLVLLGFLSAISLFATVWLRLFSRGPLEHLLHHASSGTASLAVRGLRPAPRTAQPG
ncbi:DUF418 domain-containing protein [Streptomyces sp. WM6378]|uniref:DUF418 domain-containing protein n=1 Tax=Streptomyces sp. WM6378 TaxID=1415557 RepID=UPI0006AE7E3A|nr:DUF418 domain-containing protein [Streptomyces sp. WM6378]